VCACISVRMLCEKTRMLPGRDRKGNLTNCVPYNCPTNWQPIFSGTCYGPETVFLVPNYKKSRVVIVFLIT
jgi:hypothetical protein